MSSKARKKKAKVKKVSFKDKSWFQIVTPKIFNYKPIGEILGVEDNILGRTIETLLFDFTQKYTDISLKLNFQVTDVNLEGKKCNTVFIGHEYTNDFIRSLIGRGSS
ncbi:MAG: 30S ribosomal protein S3ae, partial [Candidatus Thorarchaeota archaeon]